MNLKRWVVSSVTILIVFIALASCSITSPPDQIDGSELAAFILTHVVAEISNGRGQFPEIIKQSSVELPSNASIIVWAPAQMTNYNSFDSLNTVKAYRVWWYTGNQLIEAKDNQVAIRIWRLHQEENLEAESWGGCYYEFGIVSESSDKQEATVYLGGVCNSLSGQGEIYTLKASTPGYWQIIDSITIWVS